MWEGIVYAGIDRKLYPEWKGWRIIDRYKILYVKQPEVLPYAISSDNLLREYVKDFYETHEHVDKETR